MTYYNIVETAPRDWKDTNTILNMGGTHYGTIVRGQGWLRKFVIDLTDEELVIIKLTLSSEVTITKLTDGEVAKFKKRHYL